MAENMFPSDGSSQSGGVFSSVTQIPSMEHTAVEEAIQAQSQPASSVRSTARKEPIQAQSQSHSLVQSTGRETLICNFCQNVIRVGSESKKATSKVCFTILEEEEEEEEIPLRNVKARIVKDFDNNGSHEAELLVEGLLAHINENDFSPSGKKLLGIVKEELKEIFQLLNTYSRPKSK